MAPENWWLLLSRKASLWRRTPFHTARQMVREALQTLILAALPQDTWETWCFHGGTALRLLHRLPRFSEDLDLGVVRGGLAPGRFEARIQRAAEVLQSRGLLVRVTFRYAHGKGVAFFSFPDILSDLGVAGGSGHGLTIRLTAAVHPVAPADEDRTMHWEALSFPLRCRTRAGLLAGKIAAFFTRPRVKGRDVFDILWTQTVGFPPPDLGYLNERMLLEGRVQPLDDTTWRMLLWRRTQALDWEEDVMRDLRPFLAGPPPGWFRQEKVYQVLGLPQRWCPG